MAKKRLKTLSDVGILTPNSFDEEKLTLSIDQNVNDGMRRLMDYAIMWSELSPIRKRRARCRDYLLGKQWNETVTVNGRTMTEEAYIKMQGRVPLKNNQIQHVVKSIIGQFLKNPPKSIIISRTREKQSEAEMLQNALESANTYNHSEHMNSHLLREFLISGVCLNKVTFQYIKEKNFADAKHTPLTIDEIWFNPDIKDPLGRDIRTFGCFIDLGIDEAISVFAENEHDEYLLREWFSKYKTVDVFRNQMNSNHFDSLDFFGGPDNNKVRIYECWELRAEWRYIVHDTMIGTNEPQKMSNTVLEAVTKENQQRISEYTAEGIPLQEIPLIRVTKKFEEFWHYTYMTQGGEILREGETPYMHEEHPFIATFHPLLDGEVKGFVDDLIDLQRYINRSIITIDFIISSSAKGVLLVPEESIPDDMDINDFADEWTKFNGVIKIKKKAGTELPTQIAANNTNIGVFDLLNLQLGLFQKESGVSDALQGQAPGSGTPASLYAMQSQNSSVNLIDTIDTFLKHIERRDTKMLKTIVQFYDEERYLAISGAAYSEEAKLYNPIAAKSIDWDNKVEEGNSTPVFRQMQDEFLFKLFEAQAIDIKMLLSNSSIPMADNLLDQINKREAGMQEGGGQGIDPAMLQQIQQGGNPEGMKMIQQLMGQ